jgi:hypothetical protein
MGIPQHYSLEIPTRCLHLLDLTQRSVTDDTAERFGGPLTTTMMLALATPMISLPYERIYKHVELDGTEGYADDRTLNTPFAEKLDAEINKTALKQNRYFGPLRWSFMKDVEVFNIAKRLPADLADGLNTDEATNHAQAMSLAQFIACIRNALAHGGIMYLDENGRSSEGTAAMLLFVSAKQRWPDPVFDEKKRKCISARPVTESLRLLRIGEAEFRTFLGGWVEWLNTLGVLEEFRRG